MSDLEHDPELTSNFQELKALLLAAPRDQIDPVLFPLIRAWSDPATPLQILEVLDRGVNGSLISGFVVKILDALFVSNCIYFGVTQEEVKAKASWRGKPS